MTILSGMPDWSDTRHTPVMSVLPPTQSYGVMFATVALTSR